MNERYVLQELKEIKSLLTEINCKLNANESNEVIGQKIKSIRLSKGMTLAEFGAELLPVANKGTVSNWEHGVNIPSAVRLEQISRLGNIPIEKLIYKDFRGGEEDKSK